MSKVIFKVGDDISTDAIYPGRFMATVLPSETPQFAFCDYPEFNNMVRNNEIKNGDIIIGGLNFGCGSSREQAVSTLKGLEVTIIAKSFARIFLQNAINLGLRCVICPEIDADKSDEIEITKDKVVNKTKGNDFSFEPLPEARQVIIDAGGLIAYTRKRLMEMQK